MLDLTIDVSGTCLGNVDKYDYLGFCTDKKLDMTSHIEKLVKKVGFKLHTMSLMRRFLTLKTTLLPYKVMIMPHFDNVDFEIDSSNKNNTDRLERGYIKELCGKKRISQILTIKKISVYF